ncbi:2-phosphosulfolactate phosphatase [Paenibacillus sp. MBLB4367]|uniref:2-phosphosulfolactate phosphatase n=1 Tax=Paenibacillus sp. MBLB4367 TaxID=3384767 RepID=UPI0039080787
MQIDVISCVNEARSDDFVGKTALVIDVLRATSNMVTGLSAGCRAIVPVETVQQAKQLHTPEDLLGGERSCNKIPGFHLGNSPFEYNREAVEGKRVVMTTTNGTRAIQKSQKAQHVLACSLLNARACAKAALEIGRDVIIVCAGTQDQFALEDGIGAGAVVKEIRGLSKNEPQVNDFGLAMESCYRQFGDSLQETLQQSATGKRLVKLGYANDIGYCARLNVYEIVPALREGALVPLVPAPTYR